MTPEMAFECLLVSHDRGLLSTMNPVLEKLSIAVEHCPTAPEACGIITNRNHELVLMDWEEDASTQLLSAIWTSPKKQKPTILAVSSDHTSIAGAHFCLRKPATTESATASLKAAYSRMLWDYRVNARCAVMSPLTARDDSRRGISITVTDIGEGGIGLSSKENLTVGNVLSFALRLPKTPFPIHIQARIVWTRDYGTAGCDFLNIPPVDRDILRDWLKARTQVKKPLISV